MVNENSLAGFSTARDTTASPVILRAAQLGERVDPPRAIWLDQSATSGVTAARPAPGRAAARGPVRQLVGAGERGRAGAGAGPAAPVPARAMACWRRSRSCAMSDVTQATEVITWL